MQNESGTYSHSDMSNLSEARKRMVSPPPASHYLSAAAVALRLSEALRCRHRFGFLLRSSLESTGFNCFRWSTNAFSGTLMSLSFFKDESGRSSKDSGKPQSWLSEGKWTKILICTNVLVYGEQCIPGSKVLQWGAKINSLIRKGQLWRLVTSSFLHVNLGHLLINCSSLYAIGPAVEKFCGPERYLTLYISSALASSAMSYKFNTKNSVGASGAIFGLVGSYVVFLLRHRDMVQGTDDALKHIVKVILLNMIMGQLIPGIDNWGHLGGFLGGAAVSWFVGPAWELQSISILDNETYEKTYEDKAPIFSLIGKPPKENRLINVVDV